MKYYICCEQTDFNKTKNVYYWTMTGKNNKGIRSGYLRLGIAYAHKFPKKVAQV
jgi:hypothetical protein